jgi:DNA segregation ATPase FtsK/SpoIIIE-like protein
VARRTASRWAPSLALDKDLQLALGAKSIRVEAPVPGKGFVGIEVPNEEASLVSLRDVMEARSSPASRGRWRSPWGRAWTARPSPPT